LKKEVILSVKSAGEDLFEYAVAKGLTSFYCEPEKIPEHLRKAIKLYSESDEADVKISHRVEEAQKTGALEIIVKTQRDIEKALAAAKSGVKTLIVKAEDWKIISLENLIANLKPLGAKLISAASSLNEIETLLTALEHGADGVIIQVSKPDEVDLIYELFNAPRKLELSEAEVTEVREVGLGERACIDTTSILSFGEGMLVGNTSSLFVLVHNESMGSAFTNPRPFRVNAGAIHSYILMPDGKTKYLSELQAGDRALIVSRNRARVAAIGRIKIERRPLKLVKVKVGEIEGSITLQDAETISLLNPNNEPIAVTSIKPGDKVLAHVSKSRARHFGRAVEEFIIEK